MEADTDTPADKLAHDRGARLDRPGVCDCGRSRNDEG